ncbi:OLC1v1017164C1 [Oldenlandia corymbosa var. corymbosa]|uniref:OLC1v1017164C1 n=1 Tax=Oldenlandia corymbosa var. corymbosa TaxID=529605 RepID=A0AAV1E8S1_OLDCO|nr:OLC1v1017164C1 [Oldenlandia corymbosa var. corymbosa]
MMIEGRLSDNELVRRICERVRWDREIKKLNMSLLFDSTDNGSRRYATIKDEPSLEVLYFLFGSAWLDLYVHTEDLLTLRGHGTRQAIHMIVVNAELGRVLLGPMMKPVGTSRDGSLFQNPANGDCMEDHSDPGYEDPANEDYIYYTGSNDSDYTLGSGESEEGHSVSSESDDGSYESEEFEEEELVTSILEQHIYSEIGKWDPSSVDRDQFSLPKWDETPDSIKLDTSIMKRLVSNPTKFGFQKSILW